ncbi:unnamed protein product [Cyprideis torosa]|uniref:Uncharacterized protein n=1 Tax=Cyprideis torosa TaxID=163714 RepID=A0A7R8W4J9_9CRUS|nr:unnamed protein product [Cyprideis torosa]CAG0884292.1 unnamed protein product [Cyprideis torosa]
MSDEQDDSGLGMDDPSVPEPLAPLPPVNNDEDLIQVDDEPDGEINDHDVDVVLGEIEEGDVPCDPCAGEPETGCFELPHGKRAFIAFKSCEVVGVDGTNGIQMQKVRTRSPVISMFASNDLLALGLENGVVQVRLCGDKDLKVVFESEPARRDGVGGGGNEDDESAFVEAVTIFSSPSGGPLVVSACGSGGLTAWDVPRSTARWSLNMEAGATRIVTSDSGGVSQLYIGCTDGKVLLVGGITGVVEKTIQAHEYGTPITDLRKDGSYLITAGMDGTLNQLTSQFTWSTSVKPGIPSLLRCPDQWLNDRIIGFYLAYLLRNHTEPTRSGRATFLTLDPSVAQLVKLSHPEMAQLSPIPSLLRCPDQWLNDRIIGFYLAYLLRNHTEPTRSGRATFLTLDPSVAQLVKLSHPEMAQAVTSDLRIPSDYDLVLVPVNDCTDPEVVLGGSHWSLLVWEKQTNTSYHLDSTESNGNLSAAEQVAGRLFSEKPSPPPSVAQMNGTAPTGSGRNQRVSRRNQNRPEEPAPRASGRNQKKKVKSVEWVAKQSNSSDCGLYVLANAAKIVNEYSPSKGFSAVNFMNVSVRGLREQIIDEIKNLQQQ